MFSDEPKYIGAQHGVYLSEVFLNNKGLLMGDLLILI